MLSSNMEDRFLLLFATCENLSRRIKVGDKRTVTCPKCQDSYEIDPGVDHAGFKTILDELFGRGWKESLPRPKPASRLNRAWREASQAALPPVAST